MLRFLLLIVGLGLMAAAALWFFTPVLDPAWEQITQQRTAQPPVATAPKAPGAGTRAPATERAPTSRAPSKSAFDSIANIINIVAGIVGVWFTFLSYRLQQRHRSQRRGRAHDA
jgi:hypothetical protein